MVLTGRRQNVLEGSVTALEADGVTALGLQVGDHLLTP